MEVELSKRHKRAFEKAKYYSQFGEDSDHLLGAVIVFKGKVIAVGWNSRKTHTRVYNTYRTLHAESAAILSANTDLTGAEIYIHRNIYDGTVACSKPCEACERLIRESGIKKVYYTDTNSYKSYKVV